jgi:hypothetical protein
MLHKCANPDCSSVFRRLSHGKLFLLEIDQAMESSHRPSPTTPPNQPKPRRRQTPAQHSRLHCFSPGAPVFGDSTGHIFGSGG